MTGKPDRSVHKINASKLYTPAENIVHERSVSPDYRGSRARVSVVHDGDVPSLQYTYASPVTSPREATGKTPRFHHRIQRHIFRGRIKNW
ncbi:hypothetical protein BaRGS_00015202 [Batillaria attramentaria]|uniref:Uncharacterized protein n=1 Tax=Batillaria attramentaria TaxID=370345 RepID=A0ABD0L2M2_9CAEN